MAIYDTEKLAEVGVLKFDLKAAGFEGRLHGVEPGIVPGPTEGALTEHVASRPHEAVPVADGELQMLLHGPGAHLLAGIVVPEGQRIVRLGALELNAVHTGKVTGVPCEYCAGHRLASYAS